MFEILIPKRMRSPERIENPSTDEVRAVTERVLEKKGLPLTTDPAKVSPEVSPFTLATRCRFYSRTLQRGLLEEGIVTDVASSANAESPPSHFYLQVGNEEDTIVDATIGQLITPHNHVFVGTRADLRTLVVEQTHGNPYRRVLTGAGGNPIFFEAKWGSTSKTVSRI